MAKTNVVFELRWIVDKAKNVKDMASYTTEAEAKKYAKSISEEFERAQIGKIETDAEGVRKMTHTFLFEKGVETASEERDQVMSAAEVTVKKQTKPIKRVIVKEKTPAKAAAPKKGKATKAPVKKATNGRGGPRGPRMPEKIDLSSNAGIIEAFGCRETTNRYKLLKLFLKVPGKHYSLDKIFETIYGSEKEGTRGAMQLVIGSIAYVAKQRNLPFALDKVKNGREVSVALVRTK